MKTRSRKKRNRWLGGLRILVYMNTKKEKKKIRWFSPTRILVLGWNIITLIYHIIWIGMTETTGIIQHIIGMLIEYLISGIYENSIIRMDKFINKKTTKSRQQKAKRILFKFFAFGSIFSATYSIAYILRILTLYFIGWGLLNTEQTKIAIINGIIFGFVIGPIVGMLVIYTRNKGLKVKITKKNSWIRKAPITGLLSLKKILTYNFILHSLMMMHQQ